MATTRKAGEFQESDHPRGHGGKFTSGGGDHGAPADPHARGHAALADPAFRAQHAERLQRADTEARGNFQSSPHSDEANHAAASWTHSEAMRIHAEHDASDGNARVQAAGDRAHAEHGGYSDERHVAAMDAIRVARDPISAAHAALSDPNFVATHQERLQQASDKARYGFNPDADDRASRFALEREAQRIHADVDAQSRGFEHAAAERAHHQGLRDADSRSRGFADQATERAHGEAEAAKAARAVEGSALAAGHITSEARDIADAHVAAHEEHQKTIDEHADKLDHAHREASDAYAALHDYADENHDGLTLKSSHDEVTQGLHETQSALHERASGNRAEPQYDRESRNVEAPLHPDERTSEDLAESVPGYVRHPDYSEHELSDHEYDQQLAAHEASHAQAVAQHETQMAAHHAEFKRRAEHAQAALERLHETQVAAHAELKRVHAESTKSEEKATSKIEHMEDGHHVIEAAFAHHERDDDGEIVDEKAAADYDRAREASRTIGEHASERIEAIGSHDLSDVLDSLKESTKSTASTIKELARHTGRAPKLIKPAKPAKKSANRPDPGDHASVWDMPPTRFKLTLTKLDLLSLVDVPAQETAAIRLIKRAGTEEMTATLNARVVKITDDADPLVYCWAFTTHSEGKPYHDLQGDAVSPDFIKAAEAFIAAGGPVDEMHDGQATSRIAFAYPMDPEIAAAMLGPAAGAAVKTSGLMVAIRPTAEQLVKLRDGTYNGVSIAGSGIREIVKAADAKCACGAAYGEADTEKCAACGEARKTARSSSRPSRLRRPVAARKAWTTADIDHLPDSSFLYVESGGKPDADSKTTPRSLRHFPYRDATGKVDLEHLRGAISKIPGSSLPKDVRDKLQVRAEKLLAAQHDASKRVRKQVVLTSPTAGHQHQVDLDDPANGWSDQLSTSYQTSEGADNGHSHAWTYDAATGAITIAEDSGHTHSIEDAVPADVMRQAALNESGERCGGCGEMCEQGCRFCPACGCAIDRRNGVPVAAPDGDPDSGPAIVIVAARAPRAFSTPSGGVRTVKQDKEPTAMADNDRIRELEANNARLEKMSTLTDAQRAHFSKLSGSDAQQFLNLSPPLRDAALAEIAKSDEVIYTSPVSGKAYRKSCSLEILELVQQADAATMAQRNTDVEKRDMQFAKRGDDTLTNFAKGAKGTLRGRIMKALDAEFKDPVEYEEAVRAMKGANHALAELNVAKGVNPHQDAAGAEQTPALQLDALVAKHASEKNVPVAKAYSAVLETVEGARLYAQIPTVRA